MYIISLFSGFGGGCLGVKKSLGKVPDLAIDINSNSLEVLHENRMSRRVEKMDISDVDAICDVVESSYHPVSHLVASPPCQDFSSSLDITSLSKERLAKIGQLASLTVDTAKIIFRLEPSTFTMENVCKIYNSKEYLEFKKILNSKYYIIETVIDPSTLENGCPTRRKRAYILGVKIPEPQKSKLASRALSKRVLGGGQTSESGAFCETAKEYIMNMNIVKKNLLFSKTNITVKDIFNKNKKYNYLWFNPRNRYNAGVVSGDAPYPTIRTGCFSKPSRNYVRRLNDANDVSKCRVLLPEELMKIQGFGDEFVLPSRFSLTERGRMLGESQCPCAQQFASTLVTRVSSWLGAQKLSKPEIHSLRCCFRLNTPTTGSASRYSRIDIFKDLLGEERPGVYFTDGSVRLLMFDMEEIYKSERSDSKSLATKILRLSKGFEEADDNPRDWQIELKERAIKTYNYDDITFIHKKTKTRCRSHQDREKFRNGKYCGRRGPQVVT